MAGSSALPLRPWFVGDAIVSFPVFVQTTIDVDLLTTALTDPGSEDLDDPELSNNVPVGIYELKFYLTSPFKLLEFCNSSVAVKILKHLYETNITVRTNYTNMFVIGNMEVRGKCSVSGIF